MPNINKVFLAGHLGKDPDIKFLPTGKALFNFSIATSHGKKKENGEWENETDWHNITMFRSNAEGKAGQLKKGDAVFVEGELRTDQWEDQNKIKHYKTYVLAWKCDVLNVKPNNTKPDPEPEPIQDDSDDLPF